MSDPILKKQSTVYFSGLPPLPQGQTIYADGVPGYLLTTEQSLINFYTKTTADGRFLNKISGGSITGDVVFQLPVGNTPLRTLRWKNAAGQYIGGVYPSTVGMDLFYNHPTDSSKDYSLKLIDTRAYIGKSSHEKYMFLDFASIPFLSLLGDTDDGYVLANTGDGGAQDGYVLVNKNYAKTNFLELSPATNKTGNLDGHTVTFSNGIWRYQATDSFNVTRSITFNFTNPGSPTINISEAAITLGAVTGGTWTDLPTGPTSYSMAAGDDKFAQIGHVKSVLPKYDAIVKTGSVNANLNQYNTVRAAVLAGKTNIYVSPGTYTASSFWPNANTAVPDKLVISGPERNKPIIEGYGKFYYGTSAIPYTRIENLKFQTTSGESTDDSLFKFHDGTHYMPTDKIEFEGCDFVNTSNSNSRCVGFSNMYIAGYYTDIIEFENCHFEFCKIGVHTVLATVSTGGSNVWIYGSEGMGTHRRIFKGCSFFNNSQEGSINTIVFAPSLIKECTFTAGNSAFRRVCINYNQPAAAVASESRIDIINNSFYFNSNSSSNPHIGLYVLYGNDSSDIFGGGCFNATDNTFFIDGTANDDASWAVEFDVRGTPAGNEFHELLFLNNTLRNFPQSGSANTYSGFKDYPGANGAIIRVGGSVNFDNSGTALSDSSDSSGSTFRAALNKTNIVR